MQAYLYTITNANLSRGLRGCGSDASALVLLTWLLDVIDRNNAQNNLLLTVVSDMINDGMNIVVL